MLGSPIPKIVNEPLSQEVGGTVIWENGLVVMTGAASVELVSNTWFPWFPDVGSHSICSVPDIIMGRPPVIHYIIMTGEWVKMAEVLICIQQAAPLQETFGKELDCTEMFEYLFYLYFTRQVS
jgi:hypothetical protein